MIGKLPIDLRDLELSSFLYQHGREQAGVTSALLRKGLAPIAPSPQEQRNATTVAKKEPDKAVKRSVGNRQDKP